MFAVVYGACPCADGELYLPREKPTGVIYREGGFLRLLAPVYMAQLTVTLSPGAGEICQPKAPRTVCHGGLGHMYGC